MNCGFNYSGCGCNSYSPFITNHLDAVDAIVVFQCLTVVVDAATAVDVTTVLDQQTGLQSF